MRLVGFALLLALVFGCTSPMTNGHKDGGQGGILPAASGGGTSVLGNGGIGQGGSSALPGGSGGHTAVGTGGGAGGVTTLPRLGGSGGNPRLGTGGASGGVAPGLGGGGRTATGGTGGTASFFFVVDRTVVNLGTIDLRTAGVGTITVTNVGGVVSGSIVVVVSAGLSATGCSGTLGPGASCSITIVAVPTSAGTFTGTVTISANPGAYPTPIQVAVVAIVGADSFTVSPTFIDLGTVPVGVAAPRQYITVTASVSITDLYFSPIGADVSFDMHATSCTNSLVADASCVVAVNFLATTAGTKKDSIMISGGGANGTTITVPITAVAQTLPKLVITPAAASFAAVTGHASPAVAFGVANIGDMPTGALSVAVTGPDAADFAITSNTCLVLASLGICTLSVVFKPSPSDSGASRSATLTVTDAGAGASSVAAALSGTPLAPAALAIDPSTTDLGQVPVGATGPATTFTLINTGDTSSGILTLAASTSELLITADGCTGVALAETGSCTFAVAFKPTSAGIKAMTLRAIGNDGVLAERVFTGTGIVIVP